MEYEQELTIPETWGVGVDDLRDLGLQDDGSFQRTNDGIIRYVITTGPYYGRHCEYNTIRRLWTLEEV